MSLKQSNTPSAKLLSVPVRRHRHRRRRDGASTGGARGLRRRLRHATGAAARGREKANDAEGRGPGLEVGRGNIN